MWNLVNLASTVAGNSLMNTTYYNGFVRIGKIRIQNEMLHCHVVQANIKYQHVKPHVLGHLQKVTI